MVKAIVQAVFRPQHLTGNNDGLEFIFRYGWIFIFVRWFYYSILFLFRDYHGRWAPFIPPPFNIDLDTYANLQRILSLPFGIILMLLMVLALHKYLGIRDKQVAPLELLNIQGVAFFLPFVIVQPVDQLIIATIGWKLIPVTILHTAILLWECWATVAIVSNRITLKASERLVSILVLFGTWIVIAGVLWR